MGFHWQGNEQFTWHEMMLLVAEITGLDATGVTAVRTAPSVPLPKDTRLDCSRLEGLLGSSRFHTCFHSGLRACLAPFCHGPVPVAASPTAAAFLADAALTQPGIVAAHTSTPLGPSAATAGATLSLTTPSRSAGAKALCTEGPDDPDTQFREELKVRGAALQELFWQELERTRNRLRQAGFVNADKANLNSMPSDWSKGAPGASQSENEAGRLRGSEVLRPEAPKIGA